MSRSPWRAASSAAKSYTFRLTNGPAASTGARAAAVWEMKPRAERRCVLMLSAGVHAGVRCLCVSLLPVVDAARYTSPFTISSGVPAATT